MRDSFTIALTWSLLQFLSFDAYHHNRFFWKVLSPVAKHAEVIPALINNNWNASLLPISQLHGCKW